MDPRDTDIEGAADSSYTLVSADAGETIEVRVAFTDDAGHEESLTSAATDTVAAAAANETLTASFSDVPAEHTGEEFTFRLGFSEELAGDFSHETLRDDAFEVTGGSVTTASRTAPPSNQEWAITVEPDSDDAVTITLPKTTDCGATGAICTGGDDPKPLSNSPAATVAATAANTPATGAPTISGTARVNETLTASVSGIADADGLAGASFEYQWIRGNTDIEGAADSSYTLVSADAGETIEVRVAFTDDAGHEESLTSPATDTVAAAANETLTASFSDVPAEHTGEEFTFRLGFSEELAGDFSHETLRDDAFEVTGGSVTTASRTAPPSNQEWAITVEPDSDDAVTITLPKTTDCGATGAICTHDGQPLSNAPAATVAGPDTPSNAPPSEIKPALRMDPSDPIVRVGETALYTITLDPGTASLGEVLRLACEGLPANASCAFSPASLVAGDEPVTATLSVTTASRLAEVLWAAAVVGGRGPAGGVWLMLVAGAVLGLVVGTREGEPRRRRIRIPALLILVVLSMQSGCAGDLPTGPSAPGRPTVEPGTYTFTVVARSEAGEVATVATSLTVQ